MKKILFGLSILTASLFADHLSAELKPQHPLAVGSNKIDFIVKDKKEDLKAGEFKLKVFMPAMPGMSYMEFEDQGLIKNGKATANINLSMSGTWQYVLKIKTKDGVESIKGSFNL